MPLKFKFKDPQTKFESSKSQKYQNPTKLLVSSIYSAKPIKRFQKKNLVILKNQIIILTIENRFFHPDPFITTTKIIFNMPTPNVLSKISFIILIGNNPFTKQSIFLSATMSNLVIPLPIFIHTRIINKHDSMPFSFKI
jgi:hypothetical protein